MSVVSGDGICSKVFLFRKRIEQASVRGLFAFVNCIINKKKTNT